MKEKLRLYIKENLEDNTKTKGKWFSKFKVFFEDTEDEEISYSSSDSMTSSKNYDYLDTSFDKPYEYNDDLEIPEFLKKRESTSNIHDFIEQHENDYNDFQTTLFNMIDERNLKDNEVYNKVHIDRRLFSKIRSDKNYHPSKETVILLGLSLELNEQEIEKLLDSAAYSLPKNNHYDLIIRFCFINKIYKLTDVNNLLEEYNCKLFNY